MDRARGLRGLIILCLGCGLVGIGAAVNAQESGSRERPNQAAPILPADAERAESGSRENIDRDIRLPPQVLPAESGSQEKADGPPPDESRSAESGSREIEHPPLRTRPDKSSDEDPDEGPDRLIPDRENAADAPPVVINGGTGLADLLLAMMVMFVGLFLVGWGLFRLGLFNPYAASLWPKRLELCLEISLRMDDFLTAFREDDFEKCQMALDALNHLNGRRSILLSNDINAAVNQFVQQAIDVKISGDDEAFQAKLHRQYEQVIEALRAGMRQEELTLEVLRSLTKAQGSHRRLRDDESSSETKSP